MRREIRRQGEITVDVKEKRGRYSPDCAGEEGEKLQDGRRVQGG